MEKSFRRDVWVAGGLLSVALLLGGGSLLFPIYRMVVEIVAVGALAWFCLRPWIAPPGLSARFAVALLVAIVFLIVLQLIPLPPSIWQALPGREVPTAVFTAVGEPDRWAPLSLTPSSTRDTLAFFLVPLAAFVAALRIGRPGQLLLLKIVAAVGLLNGLLVVLQFQGFSRLTFYMTGSLPGVGLFANKNHSAVFLVAAMPAAAFAVMTWQRIEQRVRRWVGVALIGFLALTVFGCLSRAGLALMPFGILVSAMILFPRGAGSRATLIAFGISAAAVTLLVVVLPQTAVVGSALNRFDAASDLRYSFWPVVVQGVQDFFPAGTGLGSFKQIFASLEPLEIVQPRYINHAHSDYMELALETGLAGIVLILCFIVWFIVTAALRLRRCWWGRPGFAPIAIATAGITEFLLHSALDYPLRTLALAALTGVYCAILATPPTELDLQTPRRYRRVKRERMAPAEGTAAAIGDSNGHSR